MADRANATVDLILNDKRFLDALRRIQPKMEKLLRKMQQVAVAARRMLIAATVAATASVVAWGRFEQSMARVKALTEATGQSFKSLSTLARDMGKTTVFTANQAAQAMGFLAQSGLSVQEIMGTLPSVLNLAAAGQLDMATSASIAAKIIRGMNIEVKDFAGTVDVLAKAFTTSNTNLEELGEALKFVGPVAATSGVSLQTTVAALQALADAGFSATIGGTALRRILVSLQSPKFAKFFAAAGESVADLNGELKDLPDILRTLQKVLSSTGNQVEQTAKLFDLFGLRGGPGMQILLSKGGDGLDSMRKKLQDVGGVAEKIATTQLATLFGEFRLLTSAATESAIAIGQQLAPIVSALTGTMQTAVQWFNNTSKSTKIFTASAIAASVALSALTFALAKVGPHAIVLAGAIKKVALAFALLEGEALAVTVAMNAFLVVALAAAVILIARWAVFRDLVRETAEALAEPASALDRLTKANRDLTEAEEKGADIQVAALERKRAALTDVIEEVEAHRESIQTTLKDIQSASFQDIRGFADDPADDAKQRDALIQNATRQLSKLKEQRSAIDGIIEKTRERAELEAALADEMDEQAIAANQLSQEKEKQNKIDDKGLVTLKDITDRFKILSGEATAGQIKLFDLDELGVTPILLREIAFEMGRLKDLEEELAGDEKLRLTLSGHRGDAEAIIESSMTEQERLARSLAKIAELQSRGNLTDRQAAKAVAALQTSASGSLKGKLSGADALFRRITEAAGGRGKDKNNPAVQTAKSTALTAKTSEKTAGLMDTLGDNVEEIVGFIREKLIGGSSLVGVFG